MYVPAGLGTHTPVWCFIIHACVGYDYFKHGGRGRLLFLVTLMLVHVTTKKMWLLFIVDVH